MKRVNYEKVVIIRSGKLKSRLINMLVWISKLNPHST